MVGIKYMNLIEIGQVVMEIRGVKNSELAVPVNDTLVRHTGFLATDTRPCVLIILMSYFVTLLCCISMSSRELQECNHA